MTRAFVGLGSNVGDRLANLAEAVKMLGAKGLKVGLVSSVYETDPVGPPQDDFLNAAAEVSTDLSAADLVAVLKAIEQEIGRTEGEHWGPRVIDLDLLLFGEEMINEPELTVPHAEFTNRAFALVPVLEIDPDVDLPSGEPLSAFCEKDPPGVRLFDSPQSLLGSASGALSQNSGALSQNSGALSQNSGALSQNSGALSQTIGALSQTIGAPSQTIGALSQTIEDG